jgi:hypothetical protein
LISNSQAGFQGFKPWNEVVVDSMGFCLDLPPSVSHNFWQLTYNKQKERAGLDYESYSLASAGYASFNHQLLRGKHQIIGCWTALL